MYNELLCFWEGAYQKKMKLEPNFVEKKSITTFICLVGDKVYMLVGLVGVMNTLRLLQQTPRK